MDKPTGEKWEGIFLLLLTQGGARSSLALGWYASPPWGFDWARWARQGAERVGMFSEGTSE
ncbi:hypothetical protein SBV1_1030003 [Verrucomicrobia bacterium]|nr:hypothetical protein SBV1_1030003 [Verrucomicrobiota bacterium]